MPIKHASAKSKGARLEKLVADELDEIEGVSARRQPGSGIYSTHPADVKATIRSKEYLVECKARREGPRVLDRWLGEADFLVVRVDRGSPRVYMTWDMFKELCGDQ